MSTTDTIIDTLDLHNVTLQRLLNATGVHEELLGGVAEAISELGERVKRLETSIKYIVAAVEELEGDSDVQYRDILHLQRDNSVLKKKVKALRKGE